MKKTLSVLAVLGIVACGMQSVQAFTWSNLNPATWFGSGKCGCEKPKCGCEKKKCDPCSTGYAAPCNPCEKKKIECNPCKKQIVQPCEPCQKARQICDPCNKLQEMNK